jgi:hypothetical protein
MIRRRATGARRFSWSSMASRPASTASGASPIDRLLVPASTMVTSASLASTAVLITRQSTCWVESPATASLPTGTIPSASSSVTPHILASESPASSSLGFNPACARSCSP